MKLIRNAEGEREAYSWVWKWLRINRVAAHFHRVVPEFTVSMEALIESFSAITSADSETARAFIAAAHGDANRAMDLYFEVALCRAL